MSARQPPLPFAPPPFTRAGFLISASNAAALEAISRPQAWPAHAFALIGPAGCGKSHLASVWAGERGGAVLTGPTLTLEAAAGVAAPAVALDDADQTPDPAALFHLWNLIAQRGGKLLLVGTTPPATWATPLADLASRLGALAWTEIAPPDDALLEAMLVRLAQARHMRLDRRIVAYAVLRVERSYRGVQRFVAALDEALCAPGATLGLRLASRVLVTLYAGGDAEA